jgi:hypothetical protein
MLNGGEVIIETYAALEASCNQRNCCHIPANPMTSKVARLIQWQTSSLAAFLRSERISAVCTSISTSHFSFSSLALRNVTGTKDRMFFTEKAGVPTRRILLCTCPSAASIPRTPTLRSRQLQAGQYTPSPISREITRRDCHGF